MRGFDVLLRLVLTASLAVMSTLTSSRLGEAEAKAQAAYNAGFRGQNLVTAVALALSESGADPTVINNNPATSDFSVGWWQINYFGNLYPSRAAQFGPPAALQNGDANAAAAYALSGGGSNWSPWAADFSNGHYYANLPLAQEAVQNIGQSGNTPGAAGVIPNGTTLAATTDSSNPCLWTLPSVGPLGGNCALHQSQGRALLGGAALVGGTLLVLVGVVMLISRKPARLALSVVTSGSYPAVKPPPATSRGGRGSGDEARPRTVQGRQTIGRMTDLDDESSKPSTPTDDF